MSDMDMASEGTWMLPPPPIPRDDEAETDQPEAVTDEEAFLDSIVSHVDDDSSEMVALRDKVSAWYSSCDTGTAKETPSDKVKPGSQENDEDLPLGGIDTPNRG
ncbi:MAG: hypothetical protein LBN10_10280 [Propionibacteriaceae bacterium]|jgi:hypothetical protein|nr:hypothetical protein [Propionibacteriaceae bacterium]